jgi:hypothetical protein
MQTVRLSVSIFLLIAFTVSTTQAAPTSAPKLPLTVKITTTGGIVWGWVWASWKNPQTHATVKLKCSKHLCAWQVPAGAAVHFTQKAKDSSTWPFSAWTILSGGHAVHTGKTSFDLTITQKVTVTAMYVLA